MDSRTFRSRSVRLYDLATEYERALDWLDDPENEAALEAAGGEIPAELSARLDEIEDALDAKVERVALMVRTLEARSEVAASEAKRLSSLARSYANRATSLKHYLAYCMRKTGRRKIEGDLAKVSLVVNPPSVRAQDSSRPPADFAIVDYSGRLSVMAWEILTRALNLANVPLPDHTVTLDKRAALESLKAAGEIPVEAGEYTIGGLVVERGERVQIR